MTVKVKKYATRRPLKDGEQAIKAGRRVVIMRTDEKVIAETATLMVTDVTGWTHGDWISMKLYIRQKAKKNMYYIGYNLKEKRWCRNRDKEIAEKHLADLFPWMEKVLFEYLNK